MRGVFITFEGCDGSGKSTQVKAVSTALAESGVDVLVTREPGGTPFGELVRRVLLDPSGPERGALAEMFLYAASRAELVREVIRPALESGRVVLTERFTDSTVAYQGYAGGVPLAAVEEINRIATGNLTPDLTFVFDIDEPAIAEARLVSKRKDRIELRSSEYHARVRQGYRDLASRFPDRIRLVDAEMPREQVERIVLSEVRGLLRQRMGGKIL